MTRKPRTTRHRVDSGVTELPRWREKPARHLPHITHITDSRRLRRDVVCCDDDAEFVCAALEAASRKESECDI